MDLKERRIHGEESLPIAMYAQTPSSLRYHMPCHWHPEHEIVYVRSGVMEMRLGASEDIYVLNPGDVLFIAGGTLHSGEPKGDCNYICFVFDPARVFPYDMALGDVFHKIARGDYRLDPPLIEQPDHCLSEICESMYRIMQDREGGYAFFAKAELLKFFGTILQKHLYKTNELFAIPDEKNAAIMKRVLDYIRNYYTQEISLDTLADLAHMSGNYFCRYFRRMTGQTPVDYLINYRVESACYALRNTDLNVTDVAFGCGFNDVSHFVKTFRRRVGVAPKEYRVQVRRVK